MSSERVEACLRAVRGLLGMPPSEALRKALNDCVLILDDMDDRDAVIHYIDQHTQGWERPWLRPPWDWTDAPPSPFSSMMWELYEGRHGDRMTWCVSWEMLPPARQTALLLQYPPPDPWSRWLDEMEERARDSLRVRRHRLMASVTSRHSAQEDDESTPEEALEQQLQDIVAKADGAAPTEDGEPPEGVGRVGQKITDALIGALVWLGILVLVNVSLIGIAYVLYWLGSFLKK